MTATPMERTVTSNGIHKQFYGGLHQTQPEPFRATDALHRPYHSTLRGRSVYGGGAWWLVRQVLYTGILQLRHRQGWPCRDVCGGEEPLLVFFLQCQRPEGSHHRVRVRYYGAVCIPRHCISDAHQAVRGYL